jgi:hypothetical protein
VSDPDEDDSIPPVTICFPPLEESVYYAVVDAVRDGLAFAEERLNKLRALERAIDDRSLARNRGGSAQKEEPLGVLDGIPLKRSEMRMVVAEAQRISNNYHTALKAIERPL